MDIVLYSLLALILIWATWTYNRLVSFRHRVAAAWSDIDVQLKRRYDLIPKLVDAVKAYSDFEARVQERVTRLRSAPDAAPNEERARGESELSREIGAMLLVAEDYPDLKASESFLSLQRALTEVEDHIQYARRYFNGAVRQLNILVAQFPSNLVASALGFGAEEYFEIELATERDSPEMRF